MRLERVSATARVLPRAVQLAPALTCASAGVIVVALVSEPASAVWHGRLTGMAVAGACAGLLDDTASPTLAASPTPLATRRAMRVACVVTGLASWWFVMVAVISLRTDRLPVAAVTRELAVLAVMAMLGALVVQRHNRDGKGAAGGLFAVGWFLLSFVPRPGRLPLPPDGLDPDAAGALTAVILAGVAAIIALSLDPASRWRLRVREE